MRAVHPPRTLLSLALLVVAVAGAACKRPAAPPPPAAPAPPAPAAAAPAAAAATAAPAGTTYGWALAAQEPIALTDLLAKPDKWKGQQVTVDGTVRKACTRKGCWLELASGDKPGTPGCRVTFQDYSFFVPTDSAGSRARVQGKVEIDTLSKSAVRHYEEEGAVFPGKRKDGTAPEVRIVASGVVLSRAPQ